jgi:Spy/CpxP family protein refolding chaperone
MNNRASWLIVALGAVAVASAVVAQTTDSPPGSAAATPGQGRWHPHGMMGGGMMLHALHQLNLTDAQQRSIKQILTNARTQREAQRQSAGAPNLAALSNPGDPNHAAALQDFEARVTARIQARDQIEQQIYGVLSTEQRTQLAAILAAKQAKLAQQGPR